MKSELVSLSRLFTETLFRIPDYQRGYSWGARQLNDFWEDIELLDGDRGHYTGVLTFEPVDKAQYQRWDDDLWIIESKNYTPYYVVDGQQRLTTAIVLLQCIIDRVPDGESLNYTTVDDIRRKFIFESRDRGVSRSYIFGYEKDNPSYEFLKKRILLEPGDAYTADESTIYTHNLSGAKEFFRSKIEHVSVADLGVIYAKLTQRFLFNIYVMGEHVDVFVAFETMNNRGKPLSHLELLKNRLIFLSTRLGEDVHEQSRLRRLVNESWKTVYHYLGRNSDNPLNDDHFLWTQSHLYWGEDRLCGVEGPMAGRRIRHSPEESPLSFLLAKLFTSRNIVRKDAGDSGSAAQGFAVNADSISGYAADLRDRVETYYYAWNPEAAPITDDCKIQLARLDRLGWLNNLPLVVAALKAGDPSALSRLLAALERLTFLHYLVRGYSLDLDAAQLARDIGSRKFTLAAVAGMYEGELSERVKKLDLSDEFIWPRNGDYYAWRGIRYLLFEYELHLMRASKSKRNKISWKEFCSEDYDSDYSTVEHIYPQRPASEYWRHRFGKLSVAQKNLVRHSLGNLLALSRPKNSALGNKAFDEKRDGDEASRGYRYGSYSEIEVAQVVEWTPRAILDRGLAMLRFVEQRWGLQFGDDKAKADILRLGFLLEDRARGGGDVAKS